MLFVGVFFSTERVFIHFSVKTGQERVFSVFKKCESLSIRNQTFEKNKENLLSNKGISYGCLFRFFFPKVTCSNS